MCNSSAQGKRKGTACTVPRSFPSRPGRLAVTAGRRAGPASSPRCFATLSPGNARLFAGEFVRCSLLVCRASTLGRDCALCLRIHRGKSTRRLATDATLASRVGAVVVSSAGAASASTSRSTPSASLVHALPLVVGLVRHYRSLPRFSIVSRCGSRTFTANGESQSGAASERFNDAQASGRKFRARANRLPLIKIVDFFTSLTCVRPYLTGWVSLGADSGWRSATCLRILGRLAAAPQPLRRRQHRPGVVSESSRRRNTFEDRSSL